MTLQKAAGYNSLSAVATLGNERIPSHTSWGSDNKPEAAQVLSSMFGAYFDVDLSCSPQKSSRESLFGFPIFPSHGKMEDLPPPKPPPKKKTYWIYIYIYLNILNNKIWKTAGSCLEVLILYLPITCEASQWNTACRYAIIWPWSMSNCACEMDSYYINLFFGVVGYDLTTETGHNRSHHLWSGNCCGLLLAPIQWKNTVHAWQPAAICFVHVGHKILWFSLDTWSQDAPLWFACPSTLHTGNVDIVLVLYETKQTIQ